MKEKYISENDGNSISIVVLPSKSYSLDVHFHAGVRTRASGSSSYFHLTSNNISVFSDQKIVSLTSLKFVPILNGYSLSFDWHRSLFNAPPTRFRTVKLKESIRGTSSLETFAQRLSQHVVFAF